MHTKLKRRAKFHGERRAREKKKNGKPVQKPRLCTPMYTIEEFHLFTGSVSWLIQ